MRVAICAGLFALVLLRPAAGEAPLVLVKTIDLPRVEGRIDHLSIDVTAERLFVAALGNNTVEVVDLKNGVRSRSITGFHEPQGIQVIPDTKGVAVANGQGGNLQLLDGNDFHVAKTVSLSEDADNVRYDATAKRLYVGHGSGALAAVDPADGRLLGNVRLSGHPESFQLERSGPRVFVNVPDASHIAVVDRAAMKLLTTWPVTDARANYPMALDEANHRLFIGCRRPAKILVYDIGSGRQVSSVDIVGDTDDLFYDPARKRIYVSGGEGFIDVLQQQDADRLTRTAHMPTAAGARTSLYVPQQNRLYLAVPHRGNQKAEIRVYEARN